MKGYKQNNIEVLGIIIPTIVHNEITWYPISFVYEKILLRKQASISQKYKEQIHKFEVNYGYHNTQKTNCITEEGLKTMLTNSNLRTWTNEQKKRLNLVKQHFSLGYGEDNEIKNINKENCIKYIKNYDDFTKDCIIYSMNQYENIEWQYCKVCNNTFPMLNNFYTFNQRDKKFNTTCKNCQVGENVKIFHPNVRLNDIYKNYGYKIYKCYRDKNNVDIYNHWEKVLKSRTIPKEIKNKNSYLSIVNHLYKIGKITKDNLTVKLLNDIFNLKSVGNRKNSIVSIEEIYVHLFGKDCYRYPWRYKKLKLDKVSYTEAKEIFNNYLIENNIQINNIFSFDYTKTLKKCKLNQTFNLISKNYNIGEFLKFLYKNEHPIYKFKDITIHDKCFKDKNNRIFELQYLIEKDFCIESNKIPIYITKTILKEKSNGDILIKILDKYYDGSIFKWVDEVYPNTFVKEDFKNSNIFKNGEFDSDKEFEIHKILEEYFDNVLYNQRNTDSTIEFEGYIPDWVILTNEGVILAEYYGYYINRENSSIIKKYKKKTEKKNMIYSQLQNYKKLYIYPDDLNNNYEELINKIKNITNREENVDAI